MAGSVRACRRLFQERRHVRVGRPLGRRGGERATADDAWAEHEFLPIGYEHFTRHAELIALYLSPKIVQKANAMSSGRAKKQQRSLGIAHYAWLFALWVLLVGIGFAANYFGRNDDDFADFAYVLFTASVAVALLDQLWKMKS
jgi:hypothetical protein